MPAKVKVRILAGRNLPVMDKSSDASDAFVEIKLGNTTYKTEVYRRSLNPFWNSEWFRFQVSDLELQDEPLQIRVMDYDTYSANDAIGKVYINLNPLIINPGRSMSGWLPIYDTLHGIRGEINCTVKVNLFADSNRYRHSSCGVRFFFSDIPNGYRCDAVLGFVDELLVSDDPEYQWIDKIRTPRASNEARQTLFTKLSGEVQRKLGLKAEIFGGNAVIGYQQSFDLEGGSGIVGRGIGTAVVLSKIGLPFEGIISPLHSNICAFPFPSEYLPNSHCKQQDSSTRQSLSLKKSRHPEKHLVHSISADQFFETRTTMPAIEPDSKQSALYRLESAEYDPEFYSFDEESDEIETRRNCDLITNSHGLSKCLNPDNSLESRNQVSILMKERRSSTNSIIKKLRQSNENLAKTLSNAARPLTTSMGLTKLFLLRKPSSKSQKCSSQSVEIFNYINRPVPDGPGSKMLASTSKESDKIQLGAQSITRKDDADERSLPEKNLDQNLLVPVNSRRHRNEKSQSNSIDDALSIIEERVDDDDHISVKNAPRSRISSGSQNRPRHIIKAKEIDLGDESESSYTAHTHKIVVSKSEEEAIKSDPGSSLTNPLQTDQTQKSSSHTHQSESTLSSPSQSNSLLTDDTVKAHEISTKRDSKSDNRKKLSGSDLDLTKHTNEYRCNDPIDTSTASKPTSGSFSRSELNYSQSDLVIQTTNLESNQQQQLSPHRGRLNSTSSNNFVKSVRAVKAQQQLLQNIIKHQNKNLLLSSSLKAKNAFLYPNRVYQREYPFVTLKHYPDSMILCTGGVVSVHSVKLLDYVINDEESETRDIWWTEIRREIRSHARSLNCNTVLGYCETSKVLGDVCLLSAYGTAAILKPMQVDDAESLNRERCLSPHFSFQDQPSTVKSQRSCVSPPRSLTLPQSNNSQDVTSTSPVPRMAASVPMAPRSTHSPSGTHFSNRTSPALVENLNNNGENQKSAEAEDAQVIDCSFCHTPLTGPESISMMADCTVCQSHKVTNILLMTIEPPKNLHIMSAGSLVQARVCRSKRDAHGEASAKEIGDALPFLEYELHRQLFVKLKFKCMNCLFNLSIDISVGEHMLTAVATGTGCFVLGLPVPEPPRVSIGKSTRISKENEVQRLISLNAQKNREKLDWDRINAQLASYRRRILEQQIPDEEAQEQKQEDKLTDSKSTATSQNVGSILGPSSFQSMESSQNQSSENAQSLDQSQRRQAQSSYHYHRRHHHRRRRRRHHHHHRRNHPDRHSEKNNSVALRTEDATNPLFDDSNIILEVDDNEDADIIALLIDNEIPDGYLLCNSESVPSLNQSSITSINMFTQVMRAKISGIDRFAQQFDWILQSLFVKLRRSLPCCLSNIRFVVDLPESYVVQITVTGCLLSLSGSKAVPIFVNGNNYGPEQLACVSRSDSSTTSTSSSSSSSSRTSSQSSAAPSSGSYRKSPPDEKEKEPAPTQSLQQTPETSGTTRGPLPKPLSKTNLAAFFAIGGQSSADKKKRKSRGVSSESFEMTGTMEPDSEREPSPRSVSIRQEANQKDRLGAANQSLLFRPVFKKQQTYPGANSPQISGQDRLLPKLTNSSTSETAGPPNSSSVGINSAARRATLILNKVKQPLRDLSTNLNSVVRDTSGTSQSIGGGAKADASRLKLAKQTNFSSHNSSAGINNFSALNQSGSDDPKPRFRQQSTAPDEADDEAVVGNSPRAASQLSAILGESLIADRKINTSIDITSLSYIPGAKEYHYLGNLSFSFVRETNSVRENGGLNGFIHCFLMEVYAIVRAHVSALRGNAFLSFRLQQSCIFYHSNKNQAQCLISVAGDAAQVSL